MIADCKMIECDISTGENKAAADKLKGLLNAGYDVDMLYDAGTVLLIGTKEGTEEEEVINGSSDTDTLTGGSDTDDTVTGGSDSDTLTGGDGTDTVVGG